MTVENILSLYPHAEPYFRRVPAHLRDSFILKTYDEGSIIHQRGAKLDLFGVVLEGSHSVISEFENGGVFVIETNQAISYVGEITLMASEPKSSVTLRAVTRCTVAYLPASDLWAWIEEDPQFLLKICQSTAKKLYRVSANRGERIFYSGKYLLYKYLIKQAENSGIKHQDIVSIPKTRAEICEESGVSLNTLKRHIQSLRADNVIDLHKGKIHMTKAQYDQRNEVFAEYRKVAKNGAN